MASLSLKHIYKKYPGGVTAVSDFCLEIADKEFIIFVGPSGCGKSTTLRMIAGLEEITEGELYIGDKLMNDIAPKDRDIAMVFQNYALYPHMTVYENMAFGLKLRKVPKETIKRRVEEAAKILGIESLLDRKPKAMSGGQKQRVALGRAIVREPKVFLLDEPLSNLDAKLRAAMRTEITKIHQTVGTTFIYVTHDQVEAMTMATRIVVMKDGFIQQVDSPQNLYDKPVNTFVAGFIGTPQMNFIMSKLEKRGNDAYVTFGDYAIKLPAEKAKDPNLESYFGQEVIAGIRPELIHDEPIYLSSMSENVIEANVDVTELMGAEIYLYLSIDGTETYNVESNKGESIKNDVIAKVSSRSQARAGDRIQIAIDSSRIHLFDKDTQKYIIH
ncbi:MAG: sn-glycerol-3-phosphate ABC transporter ATP-binding protein UgpC [Clostridia bacterium]|nr:sn-glycerol-3-phosphate ABC transporter ATP-binding protein UgpC [Clostridia bacterium]